MPASIAVLLAFLPSVGATQPQLLQVGNSYTFFNNLEQITAGLLAEGDSAWSGARVQRLADGGLRFVDHVERAGDGPGGAPEWRDTLVGGDGAQGWVILQEQSQIPGFPVSEVAWVDSLAAAAVLDGYVDDQGGQTMLLMTWGRREGDPSNAEIFPDFLTMQDRLERGYLDYVAALSTDDRPVWVAPAGLAFRHVYDQVAAGGGDPLAPDSAFWSLYVEDGSHPSVEGSYLAACVIYASITGRSPVGLESGPIGAPDRRLALQEAAAAVVLSGSPEIAYPWEVGSDSGPTADGGASLESPAHAGGCACSSGLEAGLSWSWLLALVALGRRNA